MSILTIITVTKDDFEGLLKTIESTKKLREDYFIQQLVIDSSNSDLRYKIEEKINTERNVIYRWQEPRGISSAFNLGLDISNCNWVWYLNGGDLLHENLDLKNFLYILSNSSADAIIFQLEYMQVNKKALHPPLWELWPPVLSWIPHPSTIVKKEIYLKYGSFDKSLKLAMDYEFWLKSFSKNVIVDMISIPIAKFDQSGASIEQNEKTRAEVRKIIRRYFGIILKRLFWQLRIILKSLIVSSKFYENKKHI